MASKLCPVLKHLLGDMNEAEADEVFEWLMETQDVSDALKEAVLPYCSTEVPDDDDEDSIDMEVEMLENPEHFMRSR